MEEMDYVQMDITSDQTQIAADSFNCIIDKGTLDSIVCSENDQRKVESMCANIYKFLSPGGCFICVSRGSPDTRLVYLQDQGLKWSIETIKVSKQPFNGSQKEIFDRLDNEPFYYVYVCEKKL